MYIEVQTREGNETGQDESGYTTLFIEYKEGDGSSKSGIGMSGRKRKVG